MSIKSLRIMPKHCAIETSVNKFTVLHMQKFWDNLLKTNEHCFFRFHTGVSDRNGIPIFEGDTLRQKSCEIPFVVEDIVSFLLMCGRYEEKHGMPIFDSLEVVNE